MIKLKRIAGYSSGCHFGLIYRIVNRVQIHRTHERVSVGLPKKVVKFVKESDRRLFL